MIAHTTTIGQIQSKKALPPAPYFERHAFLKEETSEKELATLHTLGLTSLTIEDLIETKTALNVIAYEPTTKLINLMIDNDVLAIARTGLNDHPHLGFLSSILPKLKKEAGATHLALCLPKSLQKLLDVFVITGELMPSLSPVDLEEHGLNEKTDFFGLLKTARLCGFKIIAVESDHHVIAFNPLHEQNMAKEILTILQSEERAKVVFIAPDRHLTCMPVGDWLPTAGILKEQKTKIFTVNQFWHSDFMPKVFDCLLTDLSRPLALAAKDTKMFHALQSKSLPIEYIVPGNWDLTIIYPRFSGKKRSLKSVLLKITAALSQTFFRRVKM